MPGSTPTYAFPYPLGTDPISDGDDQIKALAEKVEAQLGPNARVTLSNPSSPSATLFFIPQSALTQSANAGGIYSTDGTFLRSSVAGLYLCTLRITYGAATGRAFFQLVPSSGTPSEFRAETTVSSDRHTLTALIALPAAGGVKVEGFVTTTAAPFTAAGSLAMVRVGGSAA